MRPASDKFLELVRQSHVIATTCELVFPGSSDPIAVPVEDGSTRNDRTAMSRRAGTVQIPWSLAAGADLGVDLRTLSLGGYAIIGRGIRFADGSTEIIQLGRLRVESVSWDTLDASASLELADRMAQVRDEPFTAPFPVAGMTASQAAVAIVQAVFGSAIAYHTPYQPTDVFVDATYTGARSDALSALEQSCAGETYFDANGDFVFNRAPGDSEPVVWTVDVGVTGVMVDAQENLDRTGIYNGVLVEGQPDAESPPISALAVFDDPSSPIRWGGPFGKVALIAQSTTVQTVEQAAATARALLGLRLKQTRSVDLTIAPNPALEAGDTIRVDFPDGRVEEHLVDAVTTDLGTGAQQLVTRTHVPPSAELLELGGPDRLFYGRQAWRELAA
jgi:uncharacterized protein DUF5047